MKYLGNNIIIRSIFAALALGILAVGIISLATMSHSGMMNSVSCPVASSSQDCSQPNTANTCVDYHLGIIQNLTNVTPCNAGVELFGFLLASLLIFTVFGILNFPSSLYSRIKIQLRQFLEKTIFAFQRQLGFWLAIIEKRDPVYAFVLA